MNVDDSISLLEYFDVCGEPTANPTSTNPIAGLSAVFSSTTVNTLLPQGGGYGGSLSLLCQLVDTYTTLQHAIIVCAECYTQNIAAQIVHRFLVLELRRDGKKTIWVRLDRRRSKLVNTRRFLFARASTQSNDTVCEVQRTPMLRLR